MILYYQARARALANGRGHHLAAILRRRRKPVRVGINNNKTHPKAKRQFSNGKEVACLHAEMDALIAYLQVLGTMVDFSTYEAEDLSNKR